MRIQLDQIGDQPYTWNQTREIPALEQDGQVLSRLSPVVWRGEIRRVISDFLLRSQLSYTQTSTCSRCLGPAVAPVEETLELLIKIEEDAVEKESEEAEIELTQDDMGLLSLPSAEFDIEPLLQEQLQLNVPMRPLCRPDCRGLCPQCGADLNQESCECGAEKTDPRWSALAALKKQLPEGPDGKANG